MNQILLLHGAIGSKDQLQPLKSLLENDFIVHSLNFGGHGGEAFGNDFSIQGFSVEVAEYIRQQDISPVHIFGYSMGGYVAAYLALKQPGLVKCVVTLATKFHWDESIAAKEIKMLDGDKIAEKLPAFAEQLAQRHAPNNWKAVLQKTGEMLLAMGIDNPLKETDYGKIETPVLVMLGDRDKMVSFDETVGVYQSLPNGSMAVLPASPHPFEQVDAGQLAYQIRHFISRISLMKEDF
ncbi:MAG: alpha/beta hydrolase [Bacteroidota bacterium]